MGEVARDDQGNEARTIFGAKRARVLVEIGLARTQNTVLALALAKQRGRHRLVVEREIEAASGLTQRSIGGLNCDSTPLR